MVRIGEAFGWRTMACVITYNEDGFIGPCVEQLKPWVDKVVVFHSTMPWSPPRWPLDGTLGVLEEFHPDVEVIMRYWPVETPQRDFSLKLAESRGYQYAMIVDADEFYTTETLEYLASVDWLAKGERGVRVKQKHYWRNLEWRLQPLDTWTPCVLARTDQRWRVFRDLNVPLDEQFLVDQFKEDHFMHHLSFVRSFERVVLKMLNSSHADAVVRSWWDRWKHRSIEMDLDRNGSCWPYMAADMRPKQDPAPQEIQDRIARWAPLVAKYQTLDLAKVLTGVGFV